MSNPSPNVDGIAVTEKDLSPRDKLRLIEQLASDLEQSLSPGSLAPCRSLYDLWADLGPAPTTKELDQARQEMWAALSREDFD